MKHIMARLFMAFMLSLPVGGCGWHVAPIGEHETYRPQHDRHLYCWIQMQFPECNFDMPEVRRMPRPELKQAFIDHFLTEFKMSVANSIHHPQIKSRDADRAIRETEETLTEMAKDLWGFTTYSPDVVWVAEVPESRLAEDAIVIHEFAHCFIDRGCVGRMNPSAGEKMAELMEFKFYQEMFNRGK